MTLVTDLDLPAFDYTDADLHGPRFHATLRDLRAQGWLAATPLGYVVLEREAAGFFLRSRSAEFPGMKIAEIFGIDDGPLYEEMRRNILHINGADHARLRGLVNPSFTPRAAERWRPAMRQYLGELLDSVLADGADRCDFVSAFAKPYPSLVIATVLGAPLEDAPLLHEWSNWVQRQFDAPTLMAERPRIERAVTELYAYLDELLAARRADPGDDLISELIAAEQEGDRLSDVELVNLVLDVLIGGIDTTQSQLAHAVRLLAEHPEQWALLRADPAARAPGAVEEALRYEPITPFTARILVEDVEYRDVAFPKDTVLLICAHSANRDTPGGDAFDIAAERGAQLPDGVAGKPLTFGAGIHYCLGANLARAELQEGLRFLAEHLEHVQLDGEPVFEGVQGVYGLRVLPLRLTRAAST
ncbi:MAG TPA: cytochrome P450 [Conexibacter sp.]|jgi:cytochrome P450|nr:cytochrome P450 [Conexibacter sp.]